MVNVSIAMAFLPLIQTLQMRCHFTHFPQFVLPYFVSLQDYEPFKLLYP
jgi:hypothetical protein